MKAHAAAMFACALAVSIPARADEARTYFDIGAKAYEAGRYIDAAHAFQEAYRLSKRPGLLFSLGQANRMEFFARSDPARLKDAVHYYEEYLHQAPSGRRVVDATDALATLKPMLANLGGAGAGSPAAVSMRPEPRVMISSPTEGARITFDGKAVSDPFMASVPAGTHHVTLSAPGYEEYRRDLVVDAQRGAPPLDIALQAMPARLTVRAPDGAEVAIDGRLQGVTPLPPLSVPAGKHFVAVTLNGRDAFSRTLTLERGQNATLQADLHVSTQRTVSWVFLGAGGAGVVAGGVLGYLAIQKQSDARSIASASKSQGNLPPSDLARYNSLSSSRDELRLASVVSLSAGAGAAVIGLVLRAFDQPQAPLPPAEQAAPGAEKPAAEPSFEISAAPVFSPGTLGASLGGRF
jgi:tetratricopeptide (TPR) repeat protein